MKYLITNADDFGLSKPITKGIIKSHTNGVLSSTTVLINYLTPAMLDLALATPALGFGLHLNIASGNPLSKQWKQNYPVFSHPVRSHPSEKYKQSSWEQHYGSLNSEIVFAEFEAQYSKFIDLFGKPPTHIDTHYNTSSVLSVFEAYMRMAITYKLPVRPPVGFTGDETTNGFEKDTSEMTPIDTYVKQLSQKKVHMVNYFSVEYMNLYDDVIAGFAQELEKISDGESIEMLFHPGFGESWREKQIQQLTNPSLKKWLKDTKVEVVTYGTCPFSNS